LSDDFGGDLITLTDDDGAEYELEHLDTLEDSGVTYMAFIPADTPDDQTEVDFIILKSEEEDGEEVLSTLDDDAEAERIYDLFMLRLSEDDEEDGAAEEDG
jgi:uncharacterized protein YrzB (UPF0473 family)